MLPLSILVQNMPPFLFALGCAFPHLTFSAVLPFLRRAQRCTVSPRPCRTVFMHFSFVHNSIGEAALHLCSDACHPSCPICGRAVSGEGASFSWRGAWHRCVQIVSDTQADTSSKCAHRLYLLIKNNKYSACERVNWG